MPDKIEQPFPKSCVCLEILCEGRKTDGRQCLQLVNILIKSVWKVWITEGWIRYIPMAQYVACFKLNLGGRVESLKFFFKLQMKFYHFDSMQKTKTKNTHNEWHSVCNGSLFIYTKILKMSTEMKMRRKRNNHPMLVHEIYRMLLRTIVM